MTTADDNETGRFPGAQPRGPRPGLAAEAPATATSRSRANERVNTALRSQPSDLSPRGRLISAPGSEGPANSPAQVQGTQSANGERKPDVAILPRAVDLASPVGARNPVLQITGDL